MSRSRIKHPPDFHILKSLGIVERSRHSESGSSCAGDSTDIRSHRQPSKVKRYDPRFDKPSKPIGGKAEGMAEKLIDINFDSDEEDDDDDEEDTLYDQRKLLRSSSSPMFPYSETKESRRVERCRAALVFVAFVNIGLCLGIVGPTLPDLQANTATASFHSTVSLISANSVGAIVAVVIGTVIFKYANPLPVMMLALVCLSVLTLIIPWSHTLSGLNFVFLLQGFCMGLVERGNSLNTCYLLGSKLRTLSYYHYLITMCISDFIFLGLLGLTLIENVSPVFKCKFSIYAAHTVSFLSQWSLAAATVERYVAICHPYLKIKFQLCKVSRAQRVILVLVVCSCLVEMWVPFMVSLKPKDGNNRSYCQSRETPPSLEVVVSITELVLSYIVPLAIIVFCSVRTCSVIIGRTRRESSHQAFPDELNSEPSHCRISRRESIVVVSRKFHSQNRRSTYFSTGIVFIIALLDCLLNLQNIVFRLYALATDSPGLSRAYMWGQLVSFVFFYTQYAINGFFIFLCPHRHQVITSMQRKSEVFLKRLSGDQLRTIRQRRTLSAPNTLEWSPTQRSVSSTPNAGGGSVSGGHPSVPNDFFPSSHSHRRSNAHRLSRCRYCSIYNDRKRPVFQLPGRITRALALDDTCGQPTMYIPRNVQASTGNHATVALHLSLDQGRDAYNRSSSIHSNSTRSTEASEYQIRRITTV